jgi:23S rRNA (guanosine2251-2'-O)-methyltransferase
VEHLPVCRVGNLPAALARAKEAGLWITGLAPGAERRFTEMDFRGPCGLVVGSEGKGLRRLVRQHCDFVVEIPMGRARIGSFNASVAAGLVLYEVFRQRRLAS